MTDSKYTVEMALLLHDYSTETDYDFHFVGKDNIFQIYTFANNTKYTVEFDGEYETVNTVRAKIENIVDVIESGETFDDDKFLDSGSLIA